MSDIPKITSAIDYKKRKETELKARIKQQRQGFSKQGLYLEQDALEIAKKLKELPDFLVDGRLFSFTKKKPYEINDLVGFATLIAWHLAICRTDSHSELTTSLQTLDKALTDFAVSMNRAALKGIKNDKRFMRKAKRLKHAYAELEIACISLTEELKPDVWLAIKHLMVAFLYHVPKASNIDIANHILNIVKTVGEIPHVAMPEFHTLRQEVGKLRRKSFI